MVRGEINMKEAEYKTENEIQRLGMEALYKGIGAVGLIRFMQQIDKGRGNYVKDRQQWQKDYTIDTLVDAIKKKNE